MVLPMRCPYQTHLEDALEHPLRLRPHRTFLGSSLPFRKHARVYLRQNLVCSVLFHTLDRMLVSGRVLTRARPKHNKTPTNHDSSSRDGFARLLYLVVVGLEIRDYLCRRLLHRLRSLFRRCRAGKLIRRVLVSLSGGGGGGRGVTATVLRDHLDQLVHNSCTRGRVCTSWKTLGQVWPI